MRRSTFFKTLLASVAAFFGLKKVEPFFKPSATKAKHVAVKFLYSSESGAHWPDCKGLPHRTVLNMWNDKGELIQYTHEEGKEPEIINLGSGWQA